MTKKLIASLISTVLLMSMIFSPSVLGANGVSEKLDTAALVGVNYKTHIQNIGWERAWKTDGDLSGTVGESKRLEALKIELTGPIPSNARILTYTHVQNRGDLGPFAMGDLAGTEGFGLRMERIRLELINLPGYELRYNVQVQNYGWLRDENDTSTWFVGGDTAGTSGKSLRLESIRVKLIKVNQYLQFYHETLASVDEHQYTTDSWADYQEVVKDNRVTLANTDEEIKAATRAIIVAQGDLVKGKDLRAYYTALEAVKEVECTPETWAVYQEVLDDNIMTQDHTQRQINAATASILKAQKNLQIKVNLTKYLKALESVRQVDYSPSSWAIYQRVLANNIMTEENSQLEVDRATKRIVEAQKNMVRVFDFTAYNALLAAVKEEDYTQLSWTVYQKVVDDNRVTENDTQTDVERAILKIEAAQEKLALAADLTGYEAVIEVVFKEDYTTSSWESYQKVIDKNGISERNTQEEIEEAIEKILEAQKKLEPVGDMTEYDEAIGDYQESKTNYTSKSWESYQKVVDANEVKPVDGQKAIDSATKKIRAAQKKLVPVGKMIAYDAAIANYTGKASLYTSKTWASYQKTLKSSRVGPDQDQKTIDKATDKIIDAQDKLVLRGDITDLEDAIASKDQLDYTPSTWTTYMKVVDSNWLTNDNPQSDIDKALAKIVAAQRKLVERADASLYADYQDLIESVDRDDYTNDSWADYQKIADSNMMTEEKSEAEMKVAIAKIEAAQRNLIFRGDTSVYDELYHKYDGKEADYTTAGFAAYQKVLDDKRNIVTVEDRQAEIDAAIRRIETAQLKLLNCTVPDELKYYDEAIQEYAGRWSEFTDESWLEYQRVVADSYVNKDSSAKAIIDATTKVLAAQKKLISNVDMTEFQNAIRLYQEDMRNGQIYRANVKSEPGAAESWDTWQAYEKKVLEYASFDAITYDWNPYVSSGTYITRSSGKAAVDGATNTLNALKARFVYRYADEFAAYDEAMKLPPDKTPDNYTRSAYGIYENQKIINTIQDEDRIKMTKEEIEARTTRMIAARTELILHPRAQQAKVAAFDEEIRIFIGKLKDEMFWDNNNKTYGENAYYTRATWDPYEAVYKKHYIDQETKLDPTDNEDRDYEAATAELVAEKDKLKITAKHAARGLTQTALQSPSVTTSQNLLTKATALVNNDKFEVTILNVPGTLNVGVDATGEVTGEAGTTVTISFKVTENDDPENNWSVTFTGIPVS